MTTIYYEKYKQAYAEMKASGASFIVFEHGGRWYELNRNRYNTQRICGARKKTGERCRSKELHRGGKCKFHGGLSTGARTPAGKARAIAAMRAGRAKWKAQLKLKNNQKISSGKLRCTRIAQARGRVKTASCPVKCQAYHHEIKIGVTGNE